MRVLLLLVCLLLWRPLCGQTTLDDYRRVVAEYSRELKMAAAGSRAAAERMGQARTGYLPRLSLDGSFSATVRDNDGAKHWTFGVLPQLVQTLYGGGAVRAAVESAALDYDIALCDEEFSQFEVRYAAEYAYWNLSAMEAFAAAVRRYVELIRSLKEVVDYRFDEGYIAKSDVLMIDARLSEAAYELLTAERNLAVARHNFNILRGAEGDTTVTLAQSIRDTVPLPQRIAAGEALARRPDYRAARLAGERAGVEVRTARSAFNPQLSVGVGASWKPHSPNRTGATLLDGEAFVRLSVPIFHGGERRRAVRAARAGQERAAWSEALLRDDIVREEMNGWTAMVEARAQVMASEQSLRIAGENLDISTYSYREGQASILDVLQAQLSWIQLYTNAIQAHYAYAVAVADYRRITADPDGE